MSEQPDYITMANDCLRVIRAMAADLPARLGELDTEQVEGLTLALRGGVALLEGKSELRPAHDAAVFILTLVGREQTRRALRAAAEATELERVYLLEAET